MKKLPIELLISYLKRGTEVDYLTEPVSRLKLRELSLVFRDLFDVSPNEKFPVLDALERFSSVFRNSYYEVVEDSELSPKVPAKCELLDDGGFKIVIKESVYKGAARDIGAYRDHIVHEMCHAFLNSVGLRPNFERAFTKNYPRYMSAEWQAKALCGEVMMPFDATNGMSERDIVKKFGVSHSEAKYRKRY